MPSSARPPARPTLRHTVSLALVLATGALLATACGGDDDPLAPPATARFGDTPVAGLDVRGNVTGAQRTGPDGTFRHAPGESVQFAIGDLALGAGTAGPGLGPLAITAGATAATDRRVANKLVLLQSLDADGQLNNGIQVTDAARTAVSAQAASIDFDQDEAAFRTGLAPLLAALESAGVFTDLDPRPRSARTAAAAVAHEARAASPRHEVTVGTGRLSGYEASDGTWQFLGIPYAQPPVGPLRWKPPQPPQAWTGVRHAIAWSDQAAQSPALERFGEGGMSEDALYLNVTAPKNAEKLPVMVWFHGGGFTSLTSNTKPFNNPAALVTRGVVQVSVNHRLGPFGYVAHPLLSAESGYGGSGNYGQMDLIAALEWVKANIAQFGGDPDQVTIFGESGGGRKVLSLMASPRAAGLFHRAISQSGTLYPDTRTLAAAEAIGTTLAANLNATTLDDLRARPWTDVVAAAAALTPYTNVDNHYLPTSERAIVEGGTHNDVPLLLVVNDNDTEDPLRTAKDVLPWLTTHSTANHYAGWFTRVPTGWTQRGLKAYHAAELTYVFNAPESVVTHFLLNLVIDPATGARLVVGDLNGNGVTGSAGDGADVFASAGFDATDTAVIDRTMTQWTNFAKTGDPSLPALAWPPYTPQAGAYVDLGAEAVAKTGLSTVLP